MKFKVFIFFVFLQLFSSTLFASNFWKCPDGYTLEDGLSINQPNALSYNSTALCWDVTHTISVVPTKEYNFLNINAICSFTSSFYFGTYSPYCSSYIYPSNVSTIRSAGTTINQYLFTVVIAFSLAFLLIRIFKKLSKKSF